MTDEPGGVTAMVVTTADWGALKAERDAFAAALDEATHTYVPVGPPPSDSCDHDYAHRDDRRAWLCAAMRADPVHQTPDAVRARLAGGAA